MAYDVPTAAALAARYPAFAGVPPETIDAHIADAVATAVDQSWAEADYPLAAMAFAAHAMSLLGIGVQDETEKYALAGVSSVKSGNFSASFDASKVKAAAGGSLDATVYGRQYKLLLRRNRGGPRVVANANVNTPSGVAENTPWAF